MKDHQDSDDEEAGKEGGGGGGRGGGGLNPNWDETNGSKHVPSRNNIHHKTNNNSRSNTSLTETGLLKPSERAGMAWNEVIKDGYGWGLTQERPSLDGTTHNTLDRSNSRTSSRICLSFSDLSRIFPSIENVTRGSQQGIHDPENSSTSLPSLTENFLSPMICYQKLETTSASVERLNLLQKKEEKRAVQRHSSTSSLRS